MDDIKTVVEIGAVVATAVWVVASVRASVNTLYSEVKQLRREQFLGSYLFGRISRDEAIQAVGIDWVELAEKQREAMLEDISWARQ